MALGGAPSVCHPRQQRSNHVDPGELGTATENAQVKLGVGGSKAVNHGCLSRAHNPKRVACSGRGSRGGEQEPRRRALNSIPIA